MSFINFNYVCGVRVQFYSFILTQFSQYHLLRSLPLSPLNGLYVFYSFLLFYAVSKSRISALYPFLFEGCFGYWASLKSPHEFIKSTFIKHGIGVSVCIALILNWFLLINIFSIFALGSSLPCFSIFKLKYISLIWLLSPF